MDLSSGQNPCTPVNIQNDFDLENKGTPLTKDQKQVLATKKPLFFMSLGCSWHFTPEIPGGFRLATTRFSISSLKEASESTKSQAMMMKVWQQPWRKETSSFSRDNLAWRPRQHMSREEMGWYMLVRIILFVHVGAKWKNGKRQNQQLVFPVWCTHLLKESVGSVS